jgi:predicted MFS family arabinose efflux permease
MMSLGGLVIGLTYLAVAAAPSWPLVALAFLVAGFGYYMLHNTLQTQATELAPGARGSAVALFAASLFLGQGLGPVLYGPVAPMSGYPALFVGAGLLTMLLGVVAVRLIRR